MVFSNHLHIDMDLSLSLWFYVGHEQLHYIVPICSEAKLLCLPSAHWLLLLLPGESRWYNLEV